MKKMSKGMLMTALICGAVYLGGSPVYANELQEFALDEYVVTAARTETKLVDTPANISVVDAQTIEERHYQDVSEVLKDVPGANVVDKGNGVGEKTIVLNGDSRVVVLVDGRRVNIDMGSTGSGSSSFDMNQMPDVDIIERIEVLKGAGGALYGSDAIGGVVNIITKKANRSFGKVSLGFGSNESRDMSAMYSIKEGKTGVMVSASKNKQGYYKYRDVKSDNTKRWPGDSEYNNEKVGFELQQELTNTTNMTIGYNYSKVDGMSNWNAYSTGSPYEKQTKSLYAKYDWLLNSKDVGYVQYYHNEFEYVNFGLMEEKTNGIDIQQALTLADNDKLVIGASWRESDVYSSEDYGSGNVTNYDDSIENIALFLNNTWEFAPTWILNTGVRYDNHSEAGNETTLSAGLNKKFNDFSHIYFNWGQVFKSPTLDNLFYDNDYNFGNKNLKPETGDSWNLGYTTKVGKSTDFEINYFESNLKDAINWLYDLNADGYKAENVSKQEKKGFELTLNHELNDNVKLTASYTYLKVESDYNNQGLLRDYNYLPNTYRVGIQYKDGKWGTDLWLRAANGGSTTLNNYYAYGGQLGTRVSYIDSSYLTVDLAVTYKATEDLNFYAKAYNLFNEAYAEQAGTTNGSYDYPAQSRRFIVGAEYKF